jgi:hypothetical protein
MDSNADLPKVTVSVQVAKGDQSRKAPSVEQIAQIEKAASAGDAFAQMRLAWCYQSGEGVPLNKQKAAYWYEQSASQGFAAAALFLAIMYLNADGVGYDPQTAIRWLEVAADRGNSIAQHRLANCYEIGEGVRRDLKLAYAWYSIALRHGKDERSLRDLDRLRPLLSERDLHEAEEISASWSIKK